MERINSGSCGRPLNRAKSSLLSDANRVHQTVNEGRRVIERLGRTTDTGVILVAIRRSFPGGGALNLTDFDSPLGHGRSSAQSES